MNLDFIVRAVEDAGLKLLLSFKARNKNHELGVKGGILEEKSPRELVIYEDLLSQELITEAIRGKHPDAAIYSEESNNLSELAADRSPIKYIIDPLDGTHNFYFGLPNWGVAVGVLNQDNHSVGGVIYLPYDGILLKNEGVQSPTMIRIDGEWQSVVTMPRQLSQALICYDNQFYKLGKQASAIYMNLTKEAFTTRITGSAVADAAFIAMGRVNGRIWNSTFSYDIAAGIAIVQGGGGVASDFCGQPVNMKAPQVIMSSDKSLHRSLLDLIFRS